MPTGYGIDATAAVSRDGPDTLEPRRNHGCRAPTANRVVMDLPARHAVACADRGDPSDVAARLAQRIDAANTVVHQGGIEPCCGHSDWRAIGYAEG